MERNNDKNSTFWKTEMKKKKWSIQNNAIIVSYFWDNLNQTISEILRREISMITKYSGKTLNH